MLDSLGSTLTKNTVNDFFSRYNKNPETDEISLEESIMSLEQAVARPMSERALLAVDPAPPANGTLTPNLNFSDFPSVDGLSQQLELTGLDAPNDEAPKLAAKGEPLPETFRESNQRVLPGLGTPKPQLSVDDINLGDVSRSPLISAESSDAEGSTLPSPADTAVEQVINIKVCPLCHQPRTSNKAEMDMVTHLALCASSDWGRVNRLVVGNYVTASQAQRKWYTNVVTKVSSGAYQLGAVCGFLHVFFEYC